MAEVGKVDSNVSLYLYGSVATGQARIAESDVDLFTIGLPVAAAAEISRELSRRVPCLVPGGRGWPGPRCTVRRRCSSSRVQEPPLV
ncbi:nucleotidyltransferase domain-containing protein [Pseudonocardia hierapolitana]|uniref:nucleotidyltransferase domain-containing protein n=1 Tax=Pseudonocardia hierapolitana TaxID=1128676 RepID=UPI003CCC6613